MTIAGIIFTSINGQRIPPPAPPTFYLRFTLVSACRHFRHRAIVVRNLLVAIKLSEYNVRGRQMIDDGIRTSWTDKDRIIGDLREGDVNVVHQLAGGVRKSHTNHRTNYI